MNDFPPPPGNEQVDTEWCELVLGFSSVPPATAKSIQGQFWASIVPELMAIKPVEIGQPDDEAWFHLRRTIRLNEDDWTARHAFARIEIIRLRTSTLDENALERVRTHPVPTPGAICAGWWPVHFLPRHDNAFLSFLQKGSLLRVVEGYTCKESLARISGPYDVCPHCREAYTLMTDEAQPWHDDLSPWFEYMVRTNMVAERTHEYAHWFGHILSGSIGH